jgi:hypothetical protein
MISVELGLEARRVDVPLRGRAPSGAAAKLFDSASAVINAGTALNSCRRDSVKLLIIVCSRAPGAPILANDV